MMRVFINYAHADHDIVESLAGTLTGHGHELLPPNKLMPGDDWAVELQSAISEADAVIYALSPDSLANEWVSWCFAAAVRAGRPVIPVLLRESSSIPDSLSGTPVVDLSAGGDAYTVLADAFNTLTNYQISVDLAAEVADVPAGIPAQAMGSLAVSRADAHAVLLPNVLNLLPPPFEWLEIPAGEVILQDASANGGSAGGAYNVGTFYISRYAVTNAQYRVFLEDTKGYASERWWSFSEEAARWRQENPMPPSISPDADVPCVGLSWYEAVAFCRWLNLKLRPSSAVQHAGLRRMTTAIGSTIALPTEQQWQRAIENDAEKMDLSGNILEWCMTAWGTDNVLLGGKVERVVRVGSTDYDEETRLRHRDLAEPESRDNRFGFRLACTL
ncbi:MAG: SUMF1/EgtB/PvdO family nonheme iron enzyme [Anaerolineae bacterium]|nr:SUMF1/EgtB/PvdO family nonheme iron enzyme [Anaerolineae bacterium]